MVDLTKIVGSISLLVALATWLLWNVLPVSLLAAMTYGSIIGFIVSIAASDALAARSTGLMGKVRML